MESRGKRDSYTTLTLAVHVHPSLNFCERASFPEAISSWLPRDRHIAALFAMTLTLYVSLRGDVFSPEAISPMPSTRSPHRCAPGDDTMPLRPARSWRGIQRLTDLLTRLNNTHDVFIPIVLCPHFRKNPQRLSAIIIRYTRQPGQH